MKITIEHKGLEGIAPAIRYLANMIYAGLTGKDVRQDVTSIPLPINPMDCPLPIRKAVEQSLQNKK